MDFQAARKLGACLARDYAEDLLRLLVNYRDISASEAASRVNIHIRTAQDFLDSLADVGILAKEEVFERKRPYYRYSLAQRNIRLDIDLGLLFAADNADSHLGRKVRERKGSGAQFVTARSGKQIASVTTWAGRGRDRRERRISLTAPQGRFLYHLPFPTADPMPVEDIMASAGVGEEHSAEILDLLGVLAEHRVIETL